MIVVKILARKNSNHKNISLNNLQRKVNESGFASLLNLDSVSISKTENLFSRRVETLQETLNVLKERKIILEFSKFHSYIFNPQLIRPSYQMHRIVVFLIDVNEVL